MRAQIANQHIFDQATAKTPPIVDAHKFVKVMTAKNRLHWNIACLLKQRNLNLAFVDIAGGDYC